MKSTAEGKMVAEAMKDIKHTVVNPGLALSGYQLC